MRCLVMGGAGFIGSHIVEQLHQSGHFVRLFDIKPNPYWNPPTEVECRWADWNNSDQVSDALKNIDIVIHLICTALPSLSNPGVSTDLSSNLLPTLQLLHICRQQKIKKVLFLSSGGTVYGIPKYQPINESHPTFPISSYGIVKLMTEKYLHLFYHSFGQEYVILRGSNVFGEFQNPSRSQGVINVFLGRLARSEAVDIWGDGQTIRDFLYVKDLARAVQLAVESENGCEIFNVGSGTGTSLSGLIHIIQEVTGQKIQVNYKPARDFDVKANVLDIDKIINSYNWRPEISLAEGILRTWKWIQNYPATS